MILSKTKIEKSEIHGLGLFADEYIQKGNKVWEFQKGFDLVITKEEFETLSEAAKEQFLNYAYVDKITKKYVLCSDDSRFFNHADIPNVSCYKPEAAHDEALVCYASKDIEIGEELTNNYAEFDADPSDVL
jgi:SET domain-containing protein